MTDLPERDRKLTNKAQGVYRKFDVRRTDGSDQPGGKHEGCEYFVLDVTHDPYAIPALTAYAKACEDTHPVLAADLRDRYSLYVPPEPAPAVFSPADLDLFRQWFNSVQDTNGGYLDAADYALARRLYEVLGMRVPGSIDKPAA
jgi:hypothetical protein